MHSELAMYRRRLQDILAGLEDAKRVSWRKVGMGGGKIHDSAGEEDLAQINDACL